MHIKSLPYIAPAMPVITDETRPYVHHFIVYEMAECSNSMTNRLTMSMIYGWAPGDEGWALPQDVGLPLFANGRNGILIEIHYNNPDLIEGLKDSSGLNFYYTIEEQKHEAGILRIGDPMLGMNEESVGRGLTQYSFTCPGTCSNTFLEPDHVGYDKGVTVVFERESSSNNSSQFVCSIHTTLLFTSYSPFTLICLSSSYASDRHKND